MCQGYKFPGSLTSLMDISVTAYAADVLFVAIACVNSVLLLKFL